MSNPYKTKRQALNDLTRCYGVLLKNRMIRDIECGTAMSCDWIGRKLYSVEMTKQTSSWRVYSATGLLCVVRKIEIMAY